MLVKQVTCNVILILKMFVPLWKQRNEKFEFVMHKAHANKYKNSLPSVVHRIAEKQEKY